MASKSQHDSIREAKNHPKIDQRVIAEYERLEKATGAGAKNPGPNYRIKPPLSTDGFRSAKRTK